MRDFIKKALTRKISVKDARDEPLQLEIPPNQKLVYGMYFAVASLAALTALETTYMLVFQSFNNEIFAAITLIIGTLLGAFYGQRS
jgi:hypothetical protein